MRFIVKFCGLLSLALVAASCSLEPEYAPGPTNELLPDDADIGKLNVVVLLIDTLRADHLGAYGYKRDTSPFIDQLARNGVVYERAFATSSYTRESVASLFTGYFPWHGAHAGWTGEPHPQLRTLAQAFQDADYETAMFSNSTMVKGPAFGRGFETAVFGTEQWGLSRASGLLSISALDWVRKRESEKPLFMYVHYLDPHGPYSPPEDLYSKFRRTDLLSGRVKLYGQLREKMDEMVADGFGIEDDRYLDLIDRYDAEIAHTDDAIRQLFEGFQDLGLSENTLFIVTADHGEEFLDHGFVEHAWTVYNESIHVPLILYRPGLLSPKRIETPVSNADVPPTLEALLGIDLKNEDPDGVPLMTREGRTVTHHERTELIIAELGIKRRNIARAIIADGMKYITAVKWLTNKERGETEQHREDLTEAFESGERVAPDSWDEPILEELYDIDRDFAESRNLLETGSRAEASKERLLKLLQEYRGRGTIDPEAEEREIDEQEIEEMEALGYIN